MTIYFAEMGDWIKIGYTQSEDASKRIAQLQTGQPEKIVLLGTIPGERDAEIGLHKELESARGNGEWFVREQVIAIVSFLIENQHPWYYCRQKSIWMLWERVFKVLPPADLSAYEDPQIRGPRSPRHMASDRIRKHRRTHGKDKAWEEKLVEQMSQHFVKLNSYVRTWEETCQS